MSIPIVGRAFTTIPGLMTYLQTVAFGPWRPRYVVMHHTGAPDIKTWDGWQRRTKPVTDEQWLFNLQKYYEGLGWKRAPHFFFTPAHYCVLSMPNFRGTHAVSFNANSWGVECVGDFDREPFDGEIRNRYMEGIAALHIIAGLSPLPFQRGVHGLHFHRDDPLTSKTCPGKMVIKSDVVARVQRAILRFDEGDHPDEHVEPEVHKAVEGTVTGVDADGLNVRAAASARAPIMRKISNDTKVPVLGEALNGTTKWLRIGDGEWVAARFVTV